MGTEQYAVVVFLKLESILRSIFLADNFFVDDRLRIEQTQGALAGEQCYDINYNYN